MAWGYLLDKGIALTAAEWHLLDEVTGPEVAAKLPEPAADPPAYRFSPAGPEPGTARAWLVSVVPRV